ncbi:MAG TPA: DCC1-like thiol-disulfide oxidoreductase family protein [Solirubrobacteraceae bacterium]|nr:DCC1-like thiol-disulfide oxidoreductase family protein [Solirubrobacteraceae bacterium]
MTEHALIYDRDCGLCRTIVAAALALDRPRRLRPVAVQSSQAARLLGGMTEEQRLDSVHIVHPDGHASSAGAALAELATLLPGFAAVGRGLRARPALSERAYRLVAGHRDVIGGLIPAAVKAAATRRIDARALD